MSSCLWLCFVRPPLPFLINSLPCHPQLLLRMRMATTKHRKMEQRRPRQRLRALGFNNPQKTLLKFWMVMLSSFNPKTLYISTFSHVAASSTSTPCSPSRLWPSRWGGLARVGDGIEGDPQVDPLSPWHTHTRTQTNTLNCRVSP